jgi:hypothetical protein
LYNELLGGNKLRLLTGGLMRRHLKKIYIALALISLGTVSVVAQNSLNGFGLTDKNVKPRMVGALVDGYLPGYPDRQLFKSATPAARAAFIKTYLGWMKAYMESATFQAEYAQYRQAQKPTPPESAGTADEQYAKQVAEQQKSIEEMKKNVAKMPPEMQKQMQETIKQMEAMVAQNAKDPQMVAMMKQAYSSQAESDKQAYKVRLAEYENKYPTDSRALIALRLRQFLDLTKDIPFDAKLVPAGNGKMKFADPQLESKPANWKLYFRAGKEVIEAGRSFTSEWLRQLEGK